jgi:hypothetical protein
MDDIEHVLQRVAVRHPNAEHRDGIIDLSRRQTRALERVAVALAQVRRNPVVKTHALLSVNVSDAS